MNIRETVRNIGRAVSDELLNRISDPEQIQAFPSHLPECSQKKFLQQSLMWRGPLPSWGNLGIGFEITSITTTCSECHGSQTVKFN